MSGETMLQQVLRSIARFRMILPGQRIAVACSGGPDSTALLLVLQELSSQLGCTLSVCHLNHRLRGEHSDQDEQFVRELAERLRLPLDLDQEDVRGRADRERANLESKARELRYAFFRSLIEAGHADRIAVGHTADDQAETVVHRLLRGAGTRGLAGIYPVVENRIVRPLIETRRGAILDWLRQRQQAWREDLSNLDLRHTRNRIRHQLLPLLAQFNPSIVRTLCDTAEIARDEESFWQSYLPPILAQAARVEAGKISLDIARLREMHPAVARRLLRWAIGKVREQGTGNREQKPQAGAADFEHIQQLFQLARGGQSGSSLPLAGGLEAKREFSHLILRTAESRSEGPGFIHYVRAPAQVEAPEIGSAFCLEIVPMRTAQAGYNENGAALLDQRFGGTNLILRNWHAGDAYKPKGHRTERKLKELFRRKRIAVSERQQWPVLVAAGKIIWVRGLEVAEEFSPSPGSEHVLFLREIRR